MKRAMGAVRPLDPDYFCPSARVAGVKFDSHKHKEAVAALPAQKAFF